MRWYTSILDADGYSLADQDYRHGYLGGLVYTSTEYFPSPEDIALPASIDSLQRSGPSRSFLGQGAIVIASFCR